MMEVPPEVMSIIINFSELLRGNIKHDGKEPPCVSVGSDKGGRSRHDKMVEFCPPGPGIFLQQYFVR